MGGKALVEIVYFDDLNEVDVFWSDEVLVDPDEILAYNQKYDPWPIHVDDELAEKSPFGCIIASGGYTISLMYQASHMIYNNDTRQWAFLGGFDWTVKFSAPVRAMDRLRNKFTILMTKPSQKGGRGTVKATTEVFNQNDELVLFIEVLFLLATRPKVANIQ